MRRALLSFALVLLPIATTDTMASLSTVAAPRIIMFYSGVLEGRRYMTDWSDNLRLLGAISLPAGATREALAGRPYTEVALYWYNPTWEPYAADTALLKTLPLPLPSSSWSLPLPPLPPEDRRRLIQPARPYLGTAEDPPLFDYLSALPDAGLRSISPGGIDLLRRYNVPVRGTEAPSR